MRIYIYTYIYIYKTRYYIYIYVNIYMTFLVAWHVTLGVSWLVHKSLVMSLIQESSCQSYKIHIRVDTFGESWPVHKSRLLYECHSFWCVAVYMYTRDSYMSAITRNKERVTQKLPICYEGLLWILRQSLFIHVYIYIYTSLLCHFWSDTPELPICYEGFLWILRSAVHIL